MEKNSNINERRTYIVTYVLAVVIVIFIFLLLIKTGALGRVFTYYPSSSITPSLKTNLFPP